MISIARLPLHKARKTLQTFQQSIRNSCCSMIHKVNKLLSFAMFPENHSREAGQRRKKCVRQKYTGPVKIHSRNHKGIFNGKFYAVVMLVLICCIVSWGNIAFAGDNPSKSGEEIKTTSTDPGAAEALTLPDFTISTLTVTPSTREHGQTFTVYCRVDNVGGSYTGTYKLRYWLVPNSGYPTGGATLIEERDISHMYGTGTSVQTFYYTPGCDVDLGTHYIFVYADATNLVSEQNESNNYTNAGPITVNPNRYIYTVEGGGTVCEGNTVPVGLSTSQPYTNYYLMRNGQQYGSVQNSGSGVWWNVSSSGIYTIEAQNQNGTGCRETMNGSATVEIHEHFGSGSVSGPQEVCPGATGISYSVSIYGAVSYSWNTTGGITIVSGQNTANVTVNFPSDFTSGQMQAYGQNACGYSLKTLNVTSLADPLGSIGAISGPDEVIQTQQDIVYTIPAVDNADEYTWTLLDGSTQVTSTPSLTYTIPADAVSGTLKVKASNTCFESSEAQLPVTVLASSGGIVQSEYDALVELYNSTNGDYWTHNTNWLVPGTLVEQWYGLSVENYHVVGFNLSGNNLTGQIPQSINNFSLLTFINFGNNQLAGPIPESIGDLNLLTTISLQENLLNGPIPESIGNLSSLLELYLYDNQLTGSIPESIRNLTVLKDLLLDRNLLSGEIPESVGKLTSLERLFLYNNQLSGSLPDSLVYLYALKELKLYNNQLSGTIPVSIGNLTLLKDLRLGTNQLTGAVPVSIGFLTALELLDLSFNELDLIPVDVTNLSLLSYYDVRNNKFTFDDLLQKIDATTYEYSDQDTIGQEETVELTAGQSYTIDLGIDPGVTSNVYVWKKDNVVIPGAPNENYYEINTTGPDDSGIYTCEVTNTILTGLTLYSYRVTVNVTGILPEIVPSEEFVYESPCSPGTYVSTVNLTTTEAYSTYQWFIDENTNDTYDAGIDQDLGTADNTDITEPGTIHLYVEDGLGNSGVGSITVETEPGQGIDDIYYVTTTADDISVVGSIRWIEDQINNSANGGTIQFCIPGMAPHEIVLDEGLHFTKPVVIEGSTQPANGYAGIEPKIILSQSHIHYMIWLDAGCDGSIIRELTIKDAVFVDGIQVISNSCIIENNVIHSLTHEVYDNIGILIRGDNNVIQGNIIGTDRAGTAGLGIHGAGIMVWGGNNNIIGGINPAETNIIINCTFTEPSYLPYGYGAGIIINGSNNRTYLDPALGTVPTNGNLISGNIIYNNYYPNLDINQGIILIEGNNNKSAPAITSVLLTETNATLLGTSGPLDIIELFSSDGPENALEYITSVQANASGNWSATIAAAEEGDMFIATATDQSNNTSEFSTVFEVPSGLTPEIIPSEEFVYESPCSPGTYVNTVNLTTTEAYSTYQWFIDENTNDTYDAGIDQDLGTADNTDITEPGTIHLYVEDGLGNSGIGNIAVGTALGQGLSGIYYVTNSNTSGEGSLYEAITLSNASSENLPHQILFCESGAPYQIVLHTADGELPALTQPVTIDAMNLAQPAEINLSDELTTGINVQADNCTLKGLYIHGTTTCIWVGGPNAADKRYNILIENNILNGSYGSGVYIMGGDNHIIRANIIGTNPEGTAAIGNLYYGIQIHCFSELSTLIIGGENPEDGNLISGIGDPDDTYSCAIRIDWESVGEIQQASISNNKIGTDITGTYAIPNRNGIECLLPSATIKNNIISGNYNNGIEFNINNFIIENNKIGVNIAGDPLGNGGWGIATYETTNAIIGSTNAQTSNTIANNTLGGILLQPGEEYSYLSDPVRYVTIKKNRIFNNPVGIELGIHTSHPDQRQANDEKQPPIFTEGNPVTGMLSGTTDPATFHTGDIVEIFRSDVDGVNAWEYLAEAVVQSDGTWEVTNANLEGIEYVIATITDAPGYNSPNLENTSEFSAVFHVLIPEIIPSEEFVYESPCEAGTYLNTVNLTVAETYSTYQWFIDENTNGTYDAGIDQDMGTANNTDITEPGTIHLYVEDGSGNSGVGSITVGTEPGQGIDDIFYVTNTTDDINETGSFRWATQQINNTDNGGTIQFCIPGPAPHNINIEYNYYYDDEEIIFRKKVIIDGASQPSNGYSGNEPYINLMADTYTGIYLASGSDGSKISNLSFNTSYAQAIGLESDDNIIENNVIHSLNTSYVTRGIYCEGDNNIFRSNIIGTNRSLDPGLELNGYIGIYLGNGASGNIIGGNTVSEGNIIVNTNVDDSYITGLLGKDSSFARIGIGVNTWGDGSEDPCLNNLFLKNRIYNNNTKGIQIYPGNQNNVQPPVITHVAMGSVNSVSGTSAPNCLIELFESDGPQQALEYISGITSDPSGNWTIPVTEIGENSMFIATATNPGSNTSEFSDMFTVNCSPIEDIVTPATVCSYYENTYSSSLEHQEGYTYEWDFDDGHTSNDIQPAHTYETADDYTISLTMDIPGCGELSATKEISVTEGASAWFTGEGTYCPGEAVDLDVNFTGTGPWTFIYDPPGPGVSQPVLTETNPYILPVFVGGSYDIVEISNAECGSRSNVDEDTPVQVDFYPQIAEKVVEGGGGVCPEDPYGANVHVYYAEDGVEYQLIKDGTTPVGDPIDLSMQSIIQWENVFDPGTYTVTGTDMITQCSRPMRNSATVSILPEPQAVLSGPEDVCEGDQAIFMIDFTGESPWSVTYTIDDVEHTIENSTNSYELLNFTDGMTIDLVSVIDDNCTKTLTPDPITLTQHPLPDASFTGLQSHYCFDNAPVTITATQAGGLFTDHYGNVTDNGNGTGTYTFSYETANLLANRVAYTITNEWGCMAQSFFDVNVHGRDAQISGLEEGYCNDHLPVPLNDYVTPVGGDFYLDDNVTPMQYETFNVHENDVGLHTIRYDYTDPYGCLNSETVDVEIYEVPEVTLTNSDDNNEVCAGTIVEFETEVTQTNVAQPYRFDWQPEAYNSPFVDFTLNSTTDVEVNLTDANGCTATDNNTITVRPIPYIYCHTIEGVSCYDAADGRLGFDISNNPESRPYNWTVALYNPALFTDQSGVMNVGDDNTVYVENMPLGSYTITAEDANGCSYVSYPHIRYQGPQADLCAYPAGCGTTAGTPVNTRFRFTVWRTKTSNAGTYSYTIEDASGNAISSGSNIGFSDNYNETGTVQAVVGHTYFLHVTADDGCEMNPVSTKIISTSIRIQLPNGYTYAQCEENAPVENLTVNAQRYGSGSCIEDGNETFEYALYRIVGPGSYNIHTSWTSGGNSYTFENVTQEADYLVKVRLASIPECEDEVRIKVTDDYAIDVDAITQNPKCAESDDPRDLVGRAKTSVTGSVGNLTYRWYGTGGDISTDKIVTDLAPGTYGVEVSDERDCSASDNFTITAPPLLQDPVPDQPYAARLCEWNATVAGGTPGYTFTWSRALDYSRWVPDNSVLNVLFDGITPDNKVILVDRPAASISYAGALQPGDYTIEVKDNNGCTSSVSFIIEPPEEDIDYGLTFRWKTPEVEVKPENEPPTVTLRPPGITETIFNIEDATSECIAHSLDIIEESITGSCFDIDSLYDELTVSYATEVPYHYTLYYYDRAGNLVKTVPPEGVTTDNTRNARAAHTMETMYDYNNLGQLVEQTTPDAGTSEFIYNEMGQLRFSQNAEQRDATPERYSYTMYDELGRIVKVGEATSYENYNFEQMFNVIVSSFADLQEVANWDDVTIDPDIPDYPTDIVETQQVTKTFYSEVTPGITYLGSPQRYVLNRVSHTETENANGEIIATYYSYDPHGNVEWLVQDIPGIGKNSMAYSYDLISGNVKTVAMNNRRMDKFFHRYEYDDDNRLLAAYTSADSVIWDRDAGYIYYNHGPLKRVALGQDQIQGIDYTYTLQGWLKAINAPDLQNYENEDDGFGADRFGMTLNYFEGDFVHGSTPWDITDVHHLAAESGRDLYNGNISSWTTNINTTDVTTDTKHENILTGYTYTYDELNRIKTGTFHTFGGSSFAVTPEYGVDYSYDANGNIQSLTRSGNVDQSLGMDQLTYNYYTGTNKLRYIDDVIDPATYEEDIDDQAEGDNYVYDEIGNLTRDESEGIEIKWTVYGKVAEVIPDEAGTPADQKPHIVYSYDAAGNRVKKQVNSAPAFDGGTLNQVITDPAAVTTTYYLRDASGNIMAVYERTNEEVDAETDEYKAIFRQIEVPLYGSDRLGVYEPPIDNVLAEIPFQTADFENIGIQLAEEQDKINGYVNGITASVVWDETLETNISHIHLTSYNAAEGTPELNENVAEFPGIASPQMTVAEDEQGNLKFYAVVAGEYGTGNNNNVLLLYNRNNDLMNNSQSIVADAGKPVIATKIPGSSDDYYALITMNAGGQLYYNVIDMSLDGGLGGVFTKNELIDNVNDGYDGQMLVVENYMGENNVLLAARLDASGDLHVMRASFNQTSSPAPAEEVAISSSYGCNALKAGANGNKLAVYHYTGLTDGFTDVRPAEVLWYNLDENYEVIDAAGGPVQSYTIPGGTREGSDAEYTADGNTLLLAVDNLTDQSLQAYVPATGTGRQLLSGSSGQLSRSSDGNVYYSSSGSGELLAISNSLGISSATTSTMPLNGAMAMQAERTVDIDRSEQLLARHIGIKQYELKDHLGNVRALVSDQRNAAKEAQILALSHYYPFGMLQPGRHWEDGEYRFGFNGKEMDNDFSSGKKGAIYDYGFRIYDPRIGKFLSVDPLTGNYPMLTPYQYASNRPIDGIDLDGLEHVTTIRTEGGEEIKIVTYDIVSKKLYTSIFFRNSGEVIFEYKDQELGPTRYTGTNLTLDEMWKNRREKSKLKDSGGIRFTMEGGHGEETRISTTGAYTVDITDLLELFDLVKKNSKFPKSIKNAEKDAEKVEEIFETTGLGKYLSDFYKDIPSRDNILELEDKLGCEGFDKLALKNADVGDDAWSMSLGWGPNGYRGDNFNIYKKLILTKREVTLNSKGEKKFSSKSKAEIIYDVTIVKGSKH